MKERKMEERWEGKKKGYRTRKIDREEGKER